MADVDLAERTQLHADVVAALARNLDSREARLMRLRFGLADGRSRTLSECAEAMGLSQTRVQQRANQAADVVTSA
jgi:RNA polymerase primary sigma factor